MTDDLSQLSPAETDVLRLLAAGHTVKSIAVQLGRTEGSINERLREARRKTGAASSRELARRVASQENRDQFIDLPPTPPEMPPAATPNTASRRAWWIGGTIMALGLVLAGALALGGVPGAGPAVSVNYQSNDPALTGFSFTTDQPHFALYEQEFQSQVRNEVWASASERELTQDFGQIGDDLNLSGHMTIYCRATLCRLTARYTGMSPDKMPKARVQQLQNLFRQPSRYGLYGKSELLAEYIGNWSGDPEGEERFAIYFRQRGTARQPAKHQ